MYPYGYTPEYYSPMYPGSPIVMPSMPPLEPLPSGAYFSHPHYRHAAPPSPDNFPPSPILHGQHMHSHQSPPSTPSSSSSSERTERLEVKVLRQLYSSFTKVQSTMKEVAERQEQILDRMSLLEQRVGRVDDKIERLLENTEAVAEDTKSIRSRVEDSENHDAVDSQLADLLEGVVDKLVGNFREEITEIKKSVQDTNKHVKLDPFSWMNMMAMAQRMADTAMLGEEPPKEVRHV